MHVKRNDTVKVLTGKYKGQESKVLKAMPKKDMVVLENIGKVKKHQKVRKGGQKGQIIEKLMPLHASNVKKIS